MALVAPCPEAMGPPPMQWPEDLSEAMSHLGVYGYSARDTENWQLAPGTSTGDPPQIGLRVTGHDEIEGHTHYKVQCFLTLRGQRKLDWQVQRRLARLRAGLHDCVKMELGAAYPQHFEGKPFAPRGGLRGTTGVLDVWCQALATCINVGGAPPRVVALTLRFLEVPEPTAASGHLDEESGMRSAQMSAWNRMLQTESMARGSAESIEGDEGEQEEEELDGLADAAQTAPREEEKQQKASGWAKRLDLVDDDPARAETQEKQDELRRRAEEAEEEEQARRRAEEQTRQEAEERRREAAAREEEARRQEELRRRQAEEEEAKARRRSEEQARQEDERREAVEREERARVEEETRRREEEARVAEEKAREQAEEEERKSREAAEREERARAEEDMRIKREEEARRIAEEKARAEEGERRKREAAESEEKAAEEERRRRDAARREEEEAKTSQEAVKKALPSAQPEVQAVSAAAADSEDETESEDEVTARTRAAVVAGHTKAKEAKGGVKDVRPDNAEELFGDSEEEV